MSSRGAAFSQQRALMMDAKGNSEEDLVDAQTSAQRECYGQGGWRNTTSERAKQPHTQRTKREAVRRSGLHVWEEGGFTAANKRRDEPLVG